MSPGKKKKLKNCLKELQNNSLWMVYSNCRLKIHKIVHQSLAASHSMLTKLNATVWFLSGNVSQEEKKKNLSIKILTIIWTLELDFLFWIDQSERKEKKKMWLVGFEVSMHGVQYISGLAFFFFKKKTA